MPRSREAERSTTRIDAATTGVSARALGRVTDHPMQRYVEPATPPVRGRVFCNGALACFEPLGRVAIYEPAVAIRMRGSWFLPSATFDVRGQLKTLVCPAIVD